MTLLIIPMTMITASAEDIGLGVIDRYEDWDLENSPTVGMGIFPMVTLTPKETEVTASSKAKTSTSGNWMTLSPFSANLGGQETYLIAGYLSGGRSGATLTIEGKRSSDADFSDITTIKPDENGIFVWAIPAANKDMNLFRVVARSGSTQVLSNAIRFGNETEEPIVKPVVTPVQTVIPMVSPVQTAIAMVSNDDSGFSLSRLSISASSTSPAVGQDVIISGRLVDQDGKGISDVSVSIDETGYPGASEADPFDSTTTDSDGRFEFTIRVAYANMVGLVAHYDGDKTHSSADSNTITFTSHT